MFAVLIGAPSIIVVSFVVVKSDRWWFTGPVVTAVDGDCDCGWVVLSLRSGDVCDVLARVAATTIV